MTLTEDKPTLRSVETLLAGAIDYAGLFPPSAVSMSEAVINYATYRNTDYAWMLGRFVVSAARLDEFHESAGDFVPRDSDNPWRLAVVVGDDVARTIDHIRTFNAENGPGIVCDVVEIRADSEGAIENAANSIPDDITAYFEVAVDEKLADLISKVALTGHRAKIRTGGLTPEAFPATHDIVKFVRCCLGAGVKFKATAGLHHPIRCFRALTYEEDSVMGTMHGFLNLFLMTGFALEGYRIALLEEMMEEEFDEVFRFDDQSIVWRDDFTLNTWQIEALRKHGIQSFGSCSFDEPVADLQKLGIL